MLGRKSFHKRVNTISCDKIKNGSDHVVIYFAVPPQSLITHVIFNTESLEGFSGTPFATLFMAVDGSATFGVYGNHVLNMVNTINLFVKDGGMIMCHVENTNVVGCEIYYQ